MIEINGRRVPRLPMDGFEKEASLLGYRKIAGVDEAGRGALAGPVIAAAVILPPGYRHGEIDDSKKLAPAKRSRLYGEIFQDAVSVGLGIVQAELIDRVNIHRATLIAMEQAVLSLDPPPEYLLVDGVNGLAMLLPQRAIVRGDSLSLSIAAASIVAKVSRDRIMEDHHRQYPDYRFDRNKGYGTGDHREAIANNGYCPLHRRSFKLKTLLADRGGLPL